MNNNKKYKKWSLGLVAPALVLAPIAVVASCSSSTEEKEAYAIKFTETNQIKATIDKTLQPSKLTADQFKAEVLEHKSDLFTIEGTLPSDSFLNDNIKITDLNPSDNDKTVSAKVTVDKANTNGEPIEKIITLTGLGYVEVTLTDLEYTIAFKDKDQSNPQEIPLTGQGDVSVETMTAEKLIDLVLTTDNKAKILDITGNDASKITDEVLANQILSATELAPTTAEGKVTFKLSVEKPENGAGNTLEKTITFTGFKKETDSTPPASPKYKITLKTTTPAKEYTFNGIDSQLASSLTTGEMVRDLIIKNKETMFELNGEVPTEQEWWESKLVISKPTPDDSQGKITFNLVLDDSNTIDPSTDSDSKINEMGVVIKGFQTGPVTGDETTAMNTEISTVTLGLNGTIAEINADNEINPKWVLDHKRLLFKQGFNLIQDEADITEVTLTENTKKGDLSFKIVANKWFQQDQSLGTTEKKFTVKIKGFPVANTKGQLLKHKSSETAPLEIGLVDPILAEGTYDEFVNKSAEIFNKEFVFNYRKHLLTGDFSKIDAGTADDFLFEYPADTNTPKRFVKIVPDQSKKVIEITFTILKEKLVEGTSAPAANKEYTIKFNGFKASSN